MVDYQSIAPEQGDLATFDRVVAQAHALGLKVGRGGCIVPSLPLSRHLSSLALVLAPSLAMPCEDSGASVRPRHQVVMDMVLNHTSDQHPWFLEAAADRGSPRRDWYARET